VKRKYLGGMQRIGTKTVTYVELNLVLRSVKRLYYFRTSSQARRAGNK